MLAFDFHMNVHLVRAQIEFKKKLLRNIKNK